jgi:hypothetical protein
LLSRLLQVLYLDVAPGAARDGLVQLGEATLQHFKAAAGGSLAVDEGGRGFTPHVTVAKTSRLIGRRQKGAQTVVRDLRAAHAAIQTTSVFATLYVLCLALLSQNFTGFCHCRQALVASASSTTSKVLFKPGATCESRHAT